jgi:predicted amidohydrolase YtcJ
VGRAAARTDADRRRLRLAPGPVERRRLLVAGSDFPVEGVAPLWGVYAAVTRQDHAGQPVGGWRAGELLSLGEALTAFTAGPAYAAFAEARRGRMAPGMVADLTVYDRRLTADASLLATEVDLTIVGGEIVYERGAK